MLRVFFVRFQMVAPIRTVRNLRGRPRKGGRALVDLFVAATL